MAHYILYFDTVASLRLESNSWESLYLRYNGCTTVYLVLWFNVRYEANFFDEEILNLFDGTKINIEIDFLELQSDRLFVHD